MSEAGARPAATGSPPARPAPRGVCAAGPASRDSASAVGRQRLVRLAGRSEQPGDGRQAPADVDRRRGAGPRLGRQRLPRRQHRPVRRQRVLACGRPCRSAPPARSSTAPAPAARRGPSPCPAGRRQLAVEVGGRLQQPVAQLLELVLLEQEVLADAGVERLDRLDGQVVPRLHGGPGAAPGRRWPWPARR